MIGAVPPPLRAQLPWEARTVALALDRPGPLDTPKQLDHEPLPGAARLLNRTPAFGIEPATAGGKLDAARHFYFREETAEQLVERSRRALWSKRRAVEESRWLARRLAALESPMAFRYLRTNDCASYIEQDPTDGMLRARNYCGGRWCKTCSRIRQSKLIHGYKDVIEGWEEGYFVTLTVRRLGFDDMLGLADDEVQAVADRMHTMLQVFNACKRSIKRKHKLTFRAVRSMETTVDPAKGYHVHYHVAVEGEEQARLLVEKWPAFAADYGLHAEVWGQDVRPIDEGTVQELFKYTSKLPKSSRNSEDGEARQDFFRMLDVVFQACHGKRMVQPVGVRMEGDGARLEEVTPDDAYLVAVDRPEEGLVWEWDDDLRNWCDYTTGAALAPAEEEYGYDDNGDLRAAVRFGPIADLVAALDADESPP